MSKNNVQTCKRTTHEALPENEALAKDKNARASDVRSAVRATFRRITGKLFRRKGNQNQEKVNVEVEKKIAHMNITMTMNHVMR